MIGFVLDNWSWLALIGTGPLAFVARAGGRRGVMWALLAASVLLVIWTGVSAARDWLAVHDAAIEARVEAACRDRVLEAETTLRRQLADQAARLAVLNAARAAARAEADAAGAAETKTIIKEVIRVSPSAQTCVFDAVEADALNRLR